MSLRTTSVVDTSQNLSGRGSVSLAERALSMVASRKGQGRDGAGLLANASWAQRMAEAAVADDQSRLTALSHEMRAARVPIEVIIDVVIPEAARELGRRWSDDRIGFSATSIGTARLQALLRDLMRTGTAPLISGLANAQPAMLIVVPEGEQHTLGALIAGAQLTRAGFDTVLSLCESVTRLRMRLRAERFAGVCLSISRVETLETARQLIEIIRRECNYPIKVLVGGAAVEDARNIGLSADAITNDLPEALRWCGLRISTPVARRGATRT